MHAKLLILYYDSFLRVIITSANLTSLDWESFENALFVQDFHRTKEKISDAPAFGRELYSFLGALKVPNFIRNSLTCYDFSTATVNLVPSIPGYHMYNQEQTYGYLRIARILQDNGLTVEPGDNGMKLEYQTSAIGAIDEYWLREFYRSCSGGLAAKEVYKMKELPVDIVYPSQRTISNAEHAHNHQFHLKEAYYSRPNFPKALLRDSLCKQPGRLSHSKMFLAKLRKSIPLKGAEKTHVIGWDYIGSHNLSSGAWGRINNMVPGSRFRRMHFRINNFDLGVLRILTTDKIIDNPADLQSSLECLVTPSYTSPPPRYNHDDSPYFDPPDL
ncbi:phospholipase D/nuclease [Basidiobolus meristosporus CBS 931.73]|uniref:Phospholipase D/nuclease n=1 Tax=Basidiobolus meristosporus CBS 931.73 TaxID=1314790 RepID=A0A1Y1XT85_9FUNG|nr:phospholipase D/nuclease [Basidiobolus meristosporus CBS 931.73]|eukprot:ORX88905.1 phospholipase D/nuclease [Basidiobolus meristosporus CBS 931.73]